MSGASSRNAERSKSSYEQLENDKRGESEDLDEEKDMYNEQMEMKEKQSKGQNNDKVARNETSKGNKCKQNKQNLFPVPLCSRDSMVKLFYNVVSLVCSFSPHQFSSNWCFVWSN